MKKIVRIIIYIAGTMCLSLGVVLNTKTGYGVAAVNSINYSISEISGVSLGNITMLVFCFYIGIQCFLTRKRFSVKVFFQLPYSYLFARITDLFNTAIHPVLNSHLERSLLLSAAILITAAGVMLSVNMNIAPNPADGLTQQIGILLHKDFGFAKNLFDIACVIITIILSLVFTGRIIGIGAGTIILAVLIGRIIAFLNYLFRDKLLILTGISLKTEK